MEAPVDTGEWEHETDVLIAGSGAGGMVGAIAAHDRGLSALVVEKAHGFGGSTAMSGGGIWIPNNPTLRRKGLADDVEDVRAYLHAVVDTFGAASGPKGDRILRDRVADRGRDPAHQGLRQPGWLRLALL